MTLDVQFAAPSAFVVEFGTDADLAADLGQTTILSTAPQYKGETTVTPRTYEETRLETKDKLMQMRKRITRSTPINYILPLKKSWLLPYLRMSMKQ